MKLKIRARHLGSLAMAIAIVEQLKVPDQYAENEETRTMWNTVCARIRSEIFALIEEELKS
jgi:hypothetical protein